MDGAQVRSDSGAGLPARRVRLILLAILFVAAALRLPGVWQNLPFSYHGDELHFIKRAMALGSGDLNPHWFHKPAFLMYLLTFFYGVLFAAGYVLGRFESADAFGAWFLAEPGAFILIGRLVVAAFGVATVYLVYRIGRRLTGRAGLALGGALVAAVLWPMVDASQSVKADAPAGFFVAWAVLCYLKTREDPGRKPLLKAAALAGVAMGTKYYGIILVPVFLLAEFARRWTAGIAWRTVFGRGALVVSVFLLAFFVVSPFNLLDPTWGRSVAERVEGFVSPGAAPRYDPDNDVEFDPGPGSVPGASVHFLGKVVHPAALGWPLALLLAAGLVASLASRSTRGGALVVAGPGLVFMALAVTLNAYHTNARHLNAVYPLLCVLMPLGAAGLAGLVRAPARAAPAVAVVLVAGASVPTAAAAIRHDLEIVRLDSRTVAYRWIVEKLPRDARILVDDYGPVLQPNATAIARLRARLAKFPPDEAFTRHQARRLDLLERHPPEVRFDVIALGHPWWLSEEVRESELWASWKNRDAGNPLWPRFPDTLESYRQQGVRYVVTNSAARDRYPPGSDAARRFPSWNRFYRELETLEPIRVFDPAKWDGKGPRIYVYELATGR